MEVHSHCETGRALTGANCASVASRSMDSLQRSIRGLKNGLPFGLPSNHSKTGPPIKTTPILETEILKGYKPSSWSIGIW